MLSLFISLSSVPVRRFKIFDGEVVTAVRVVVECAHVREGVVGVHSLEHFKICERLSPFNLFMRELALAAAVFGLFKISAAIITAALDSVRAGFLDVLVEIAEEIVDCHAELVELEGACINASASVAVAITPKVNYLPRHKAA